MSSVRNYLKKVLSDYDLIKEDEDVQKLLDHKQFSQKPTIFTHAVPDIIRELQLVDNKTEEVPKVAEEKPYKELFEEGYKFRKTIQPLIRSSVSRTSIIPKASVTMKRQSFRESRPTTRTSQVTPSSQVSRKSKLKTPSELSQVSLDVVHVVTLIINQKLQQELKCEVGVDVFMEMPWKIISKTDILNSLKRDESKSPFYEHASSLQNYPEEEVLVGRVSLFDCESFLVAVTIHGRNVLLEEIKSDHLNKWDRIVRRSNFPIGEWNSLGSETEIEKEIIKNTRPFISYDCYLKKMYHEKVYKERFTYSDYYTELIEDGLLMLENVEGIAFPRYTQVCPQFTHASVQTMPEIPVNSTTQFTIEMRVTENEEKLKEMELDWKLLNDKLTAFFYKVDTLLTYNEEYDLYRDDYEILASIGEEITMYPNIPCEPYLTMMTFVGTKGKGINSTSWHPSQTGVIAVAYGKQHVAKTEDLNVNSDEEEFNENDSDDEKLLSSFPTSNQFDEYVENLWKEQLDVLENGLKDETYNTEDHDLAVASTEFLLQIKVFFLQN